nr:farnesylcysteine lyase isoform X1 [Ipomoea trifida]
MKTTLASSFFVFLLLIFTSESQRSPPAVCILGSGIGGSSVAHFLRTYSNPSQPEIGAIRIFERHSAVGGRMATVTIAGDTFEAGASILHPKNYHARNFTNLLNLTVKTSSSESDSSFGIWDGNKFVLKTLSSNSKLPILQKLVSFANSVLIFLRYGFSLFRMENFVEDAVNSFLKYYEGFESRPAFEDVEEMLKWSGLYNLTTRTLEEELTDAGLSTTLIQELVTVITRINYGQSVSMNALAGAVSLAGSGGGLWSVEGGNWQMAAGLINRSNVELHLGEEIESVSYLGERYELNTTKGTSYLCEVVVVATPLDELNIHFAPEISIPERKLQHTHTTFIRGLLNPSYFGLKSVSYIPELVGTIETSEVPFSSISILKQYSEQDMAYKVFSRSYMEDDLLDLIFSVRNETLKIDWAAYPHFNAPEVFAPFILDDQHLYYVNAYENAASTMETSAVSAENIARLILSRLADQAHATSDLESAGDDTSKMHSEL